MDCGEKRIINKNETSKKVWLGKNNKSQESRVKSDKKQQGLLESSIIEFVSFRYTIPVVVE